MKLPENFVIQIFTKGVNGARVIKEDPAGNLIVSLTKEGKIVSLPDLDQDGRADKVIILLEGLQNSHGMEIKCWDVRHPQNCQLYVAETEKLVQYDLVFDEKEKIYKPVNPEKILDLPKGWPEKYWHNLLAYYQGSWNRTVPTGYKIVRYILDSQGKYLGEEDFITGWLQGNEAIGRPVDILIKS